MIRMARKAAQDRRVSDASQKREDTGQDEHLENQHC